MNASEKLAASIGSRLAKARHERNLTQAQVASASKTNKNYYAKVERGEAVPSILMLEKFVKALKISSSDVLPF